MKKFLSIVKQPAVLIAFGVGVIAALAYGSVFAFARPVARALPKSEAM